MPNDKGSAVSGFFADDPQGFPATKGNAVTDAYDKVKENSRKMARDTAQKAGADTKTPSYKRGGIVKRTGLAKLHKGEKVLTRKQAGKHRGGKRG